MVTFSRSGHKQRPKTFTGTGAIVRVRCTVCNAIIGETRARASVIGTSHLRAWCKKHLPDNLNEK